MALILISFRTKVNVTSSKCYLEVILHREHSPQNFILMFSGERLQWTHNGCNVTEGKEGSCGTLL